MVRHVGERLLQDAEHGRRLVRRHHQVLPGRTQEDPQAGKTLELPRLPFDCRGKAEGIQHARPKLGGDAPHRVECAVDALERRAEPFGRLGISRADP